MRKHHSRQLRRNPRPGRKTGSVMIMVVALLVLMALIGTAYIATARYDRGSAVQNSNNVQIDLLVESVLSLCKTSVTGDLFDGNGQYRPVPREPNTALPPPPSGAPANTTILYKKLRDAFFYYNVTSTAYDRYPTNGADIDERIDYWLADRTPEFGPVLPLYPTNQYFWGRIALPLTTETGSGPTPIRSFFEDPTYVQNKAADPILLQFRNDTELVPTWIDVKGIPTPAFKIDTPYASLNPYTSVAADADGDGIADSFLVRMPIGTVNGLTYYYAVRIIDNTAALNLNTAFGDFPNVPTTNSPMAGAGDAWGRRWFPTSINLDRAFSDNEIKSIHAYRSRQNYPGTGKLQSPDRNLDSPLPDDAANTSQARSDFGYINEHDAFWHQFGRRPENPGYVPSSNRMVRYRGFSLGDLVSLVPHFVFGTPNGGGIAETQMGLDIGPGNSLAGPPLTGGGTRFKAYGPDQAIVWGDENFNYNNPNTYSRRPLAVTSNTVSNAISPRFMHSEDVNENGVPDPGEDTNLNGRIDPPPDINDDGNNGNDVATRDMLDYLPSKTGTRGTASPRYHLVELNMTGPNSPPWDTSETYHPRDYVQFRYPDGTVENYVYARTASATTRDPRTPDGARYWEYIPNLPSGMPVKTSLNTAGFRELYRAYWNVMAGATGNVTPYGIGTPPNDNPYIIPHMQKQFRSSLRDSHTPFSNGTYRFSPFQQLLLRSALAAVNTIDLRDSDDDVTSRSIVLKAFLRDGTLHPVEVTLYGSESQPFITEIYANANSLTDGKGDVNGTKNPKGYVAIELFNPYTKDISLENWRLGLIDRRRHRKDTVNVNNDIDDRIDIRSIAVAFSSTDVIPAGGYMILENFNGGADTASPNFAAAYVPAQALANRNQSAKKKYVAELRRVFEDDSVSPKEPGGELVLLRPRRADNKLATGARNSTTIPPIGERPFGQYNENNIYDLIPVDSFDFTGLRLKSPPTPANPTDVIVHAWHYLRSNGSGDNRWKCVYSGRYDAGKGGNSPDPEESRHEVVPKRITISLTPPAIFDDNIGGPVVKLGDSDSGSSYGSKRAVFPPIQLNNLDFAGPNPIHQTTTSSRNFFPFGGFLRAGDVMQVPFMGAYRVRELKLDTSVAGAAAKDPAIDPNTGPGWYQLANGPDVLIELNSLPMDSAFAEDSIDENNEVENIGRFCPLLRNLTDSVQGLPSITISDPTDPFSNSTQYYKYWATHSYDFAHKIFDYFTVIAPNESFSPEINPDRTLDTLKNHTSAYRYWDGSQYKHILNSNNFPDAEPVKSIDNGSSAASAGQELAGIHGLININTANWKVLSCVPWTDSPADNEIIAKAIVLQRDVGNSSVPAGPFKSIFDLLEVRDPTNASSYIFKQYQPNATSDPDDADGDFSPYNLTTSVKDGVTSPYEFEKAYLLINRISNLLTTRSDSFTAYVIVQGWRNANTPQAELVVQRRAAMLIDRSTVTKDNREPRTMLIPVE
jgi:hypothetical protein